MNNTKRIINRQIEDKIRKYLVPNKVVVLLGPRRVGKTILLKEILSQTKEPYLLLNAEDSETKELLEKRSIQNYKNLLGDRKLLVVDEAQNILEIGKSLKLMIDEINDLKILITGSSVLDINNKTGEPLTGRKKTLFLFPLCEAEYNIIESPLEKNDNLHDRLIYGNYPELLQIDNRDDKVDYLREIANSYLLKDILTYDKVRNSSQVFNLLRLIAFQIGKEVSYQELGTQLGISKNTVERYLDLLSKVFVLYKLQGFSRNMRKEVTKLSKWYFYDNGLRNILIANMNPLSLRNDIGSLWENYLMSERVKQNSYNGTIVNQYFWRTYSGQEIDLIEEKDGMLHGYEIKWNNNKKVKAPSNWTETYPNSTFTVINKTNYQDWLGL